MKVPLVPLTRNRSWGEQTDNVVALRVTVSGYGRAGVRS